MRYKYTIQAFGHSNLKATHKSTWELTTDKDLTQRGDCIIGIKVSHGANGLPLEMKRHLKNQGKIKIHIIQEDKEIITGFCEGSSKMTFNHKTDLVFRKSQFVDDRTCGINSSFVAKDVPREFVEKNKTEGKYFHVVMEIIA